jgi:hypothetical protein
LPDERRLSEVTDYDGMIAALRERMREIGVTNETIDALTGLQSGYVGKLLAPTRIKNLGPTSFGLMLQSLGLKLIVVEDAENTKKMQPRWVKREKAAPMLAMPSIPRPQWLFSSRSARSARLLQLQEQPPAERSRIARQAARARWQRQREGAQRKAAGRPPG